MTVDASIKALLQDVAVPDMPPIDVYGLARRLGVRAVHPVKQVEDGRLERAYGHTDIYVRADAPPARQRFTIAHELAHLLLLEKHMTFVARRTGGGDAELERFCDVFAATLLMPAWWIAERFEVRTHNLSTLRQVANQAQVSMSAALLRLQDVLGWRESLLRWSMDGGKWRLIAHAGLPGCSEWQVLTAPETSDALSRCATRGRDTWIDLPLSVAGRELSYQAQVDARGSSAIALLNLG